MASWVGSKSSSQDAGATASQLEAVVRAIQRTPIIDHHAHPLLTAEAVGRHALLSITTEAGGEAIHAAPTSLAHLRGVRQLAGVLGSDRTWEAVVAAIEQRRIDAPEDWTAQCLAGIETLLVDDGLDDADEVHPYTWHDDYVRSRCKRVVRIEKVVADIIRAVGVEHEGVMPSDQWAQVLDAFDAFVRDAIADPEVVGFKSVICYRTGLDIPPAVDETAAYDAFTKIAANTEDVRTFRRLQHDGLNNFIVHRVAALIRDSETRQKKPIQFHTGLGDNDITLTKSSPAHLQPFIRAYPTVPIVLLHASYPYTRDAGYLAAVYDNVYADIGEVFPFLSRDGQEHVVRQILELCPWSKILWSTDGHWFPETYILAVIQMREVLETVLCEYVRKGEIGWKAAIALVRDILFTNSNKLYHLGLEFSELEDEEVGAGAGVTPLNPYPADLDLFEAFLAGRAPPDFVRICWTDMTASPRMRMVPFRRFASLLRAGKPVDVGITKAVFGLLQNDLMTAAATSTGEYRLHPDFSSLRLGPTDGHISMYGEFREPSGAHVAACPRSLLARAVEFGAEQGLSFLLGFEIEFVLLERTDGRASYSQKYPQLPTDGHSWSTTRSFSDARIATLLRDMVAALDDAGIYVEQLHAESAPGQFELVLPPLPPVAAVDTLLHTRDLMSALATAAGFRMTLHPKPFADACGTAAHTHISVGTSTGSSSDNPDKDTINSNITTTTITTSINDSPPAVYEAFYAAILKHLRGLAAFTYSQPASYARLGDGLWAGGRWVTWGTQNRETPLRKISGSHWELKCLDGLANPYLALGAVLLAGAHGVAARETLTWRECRVDPASLTDNDRFELQIYQTLPGSVEDALAALEADQELVGYLGEELVRTYTVVKRAELDLLAEKDEPGREVWVLERY